MHALFARSRFAARVSRRSKLTKASGAVIEALERRSLLSAGDVQTTSFTDFFGNSDSGGAVVRVADQKLVQVGLGYDSAGKPIITLARFNANGTADNSFGDPDDASHLAFADLTMPGYSLAAINDVTVDPTGRIIVVGKANSPTSFDFLVAAFDAEGALDLDFATDGFAIHDFGNGGNEARAVSIGKFGEILVAGSDNFDHIFAVARYTDAGVLDLSFSGDGVAETRFVFREENRSSIDRLRAMALDEFGNIILAGGTLDSSGGDDTHDVALQRYTSHGELDPTFGSGGLVRFSLEDLDIGFGDIAYSVAVDTDGRIIVAGSTDGSAGAMLDSFVLRLNSEGSTLDSGFGTLGVVRSSFPVFSSALISDLAIQSDGAIVTAGNFQSCTDASCGTAFNSFAVGRLSTAGVPDPAFGPAGVVLSQNFQGGSPDTNLATIALQNQANGNQVLALGSWLLNGMSDDLVLVRFDLSGSHVSLSGPAAGDEGENLLFSATFSGANSTGAISFSQDQHLATVGTTSESTVVSYAWTITLNDYTAPIGTGSGTATDVLDIPFTPTDNGVYHVYISINGGAHSASLDVNVRNVEPTATINGAPESSPEGAPITLTSTVTDPSSADTHTHGWTVTKNGSFFLSGTNLTFSFTPDDNGTYVVTLTVTDDDGGVGTDVRTIEVSNVAPIATINGALESSPEGTPITLTSTLADPGSADTFTHAWTVTKDGSSLLSSTDPTFTFTPADNGTYLITLTVTDDDLGVGGDTRTISITNVAPTATINDAPASSPEGTSITLTSTVADPGSADTHTHAWTVTKDGSSFLSGTHPTFTFTPDDDASYVVTLVVTDKDGDVGSDTRTITVTNVAPTATINDAPASGLEGSSITLTSTVIDPSSADTFTHAWAVTKNGSPFSTGSASSFTFTPDDDGTYLVTLTVSDGDDVGTASASIPINNAAPTLAPISGPSEGPEGAELTFTSSFTDFGSGDTHTATWNFGDGTTFTIAAAASPLSATHSYASAGTYTVTLTVTDDDGGTHSQTTSIIITTTGTGTVVHINGTDGNNLIIVDPGSDGTLLVSVDGVVSSHSGVTRIIISAGDGSDGIWVSGDVSQNVVVFGGPGHDLIRTGAGHDILVGGDGVDLLFGDSGRDILIGGDGTDIMFGNADSDILVAGYSLYDSDLDALTALLAEWTSERSYGQRSANVLAQDITVGGVTYLFAGPRENGSIFLTGDGPGATVFDDGDIDILTGNSAQDLFLFNKGLLVFDIVTGLSGDEFGADIDFPTGP